MRRRRSNATPAQRSTRSTNNEGLCFTTEPSRLLDFPMLLALDDLYIRVELDIKLARRNLLVLFQTCQTHRSRVVILLDDLGLNRHAGRVNPDFSIFVTSIAFRNQRQVNRANATPQG